MSDADREKWDARHAQAPPGPPAAPAWLHAHDAVLPRRGRALDLACGTGRLAHFARSRGLDVTALDVSPVALAHVRAADPDIVTVERDLELDPRLPRGPFDLLTCFHYRQPALWPAMISVLSPGGVLAAELLGVANLERHAHPTRGWLADPGELSHAAAGLEVIFLQEGWLDDRYVERLLARKPT